MWKDKVNKMMADTMTSRMNGRLASERTQTLTKAVVFASIKRLHELGYKIQDPKNLGERHIAALVKDWWYAKHHKIKTIQNDLSRLRVFFSKIGKSGMIGSLEKYLPEVDPKLLVVRAVARQTKSWSGNGIDLKQKFFEVDARDTRLGLMLRLELAFGLRREEAIKCDPHAQDYGQYLQVFPGQGKGGRCRNIPIISQAQRATLDFVKSQVSKNTKLGWEYTPSGKPASLAQNLRRYENLMASLGFTKSDLGVTGHGLRAQFAENHSLLLGMLPPTLGGLPRQLEKEDVTLKRIRLAQALGHSRGGITNAYIGSHGNKRNSAPAESSIKNIKIGMNLIETVGLPPIDIERMRDCFFIQDLMAEFDVHMSHIQAHELWQACSRRHGVEWMKPESEVTAAIEAEALFLIKKLLTKPEGK